MSEHLQLQFMDPAAYAAIDTMDDTTLDDVSFGVIGIDAETMVRRDNRVESALAGISPGRVLGSPLFTAVAPCMNNFMVAQRIEDAVASGEALDALVDYVLTLRMRPIKVKLRLLSSPERKYKYVLIDRRSR